MKIIAKNKETYILEIAEDELSNLLGYYSSYDSKPREIVKYAMDTNSEVSISAMYRQLYSLEKNKKRVEEVSSTLEDILKSLKIIDPIIHTIKE